MTWTSSTAWSPEKWCSGGNGPLRSGWRLFPFLGIDRSEGDFSPAQRGDDGGDAVRRIKLDGGGLEVGGDGGFGDAEDLRDFPGGLAGGGPLQHFAFAPGQDARR